MAGDTPKTLSSDEIKKLVEAEEHDNAAPGGPVETGSAPGNPTDGDWRGPYGYGHRAYRPDPQAHYDFDPGPSRTLPPAEPPPPEPKTLWKRPLR